MRHKNEIDSKKESERDTERDLRQKTKDTKFTGVSQKSERGGVPYREQATPSPPASNEEYGASCVQLLRKWFLKLPKVQYNAKRIKNKHTVDQWGKSLLTFDLQLDWDAAVQSEYSVVATECKHHCMPVSVCHVHLPESHTFGPVIYSPQEVHFIMSKTKTNKQFI